jgi:hypothetical protein
VEIFGKKCLPEKVIYQTFLQVSSIEDDKTSILRPSFAYIFFVSKVFAFFSRDARTFSPATIRLFQDGGQIKRKKDIYHHGPKPIPIICHLPDPPCFSLVTLPLIPKFKFCEEKVFKLYYHFF